VILAIDGLQPDMGHDVGDPRMPVWRTAAGKNVVVCSPSRFGRTAQTGQASAQLPIAGVISDGQQSIRQAVKTALPEVAHALCHFHYLREAAKRNLEQTVTLKQVRGIRAIEHSVSNDDNLKHRSRAGYCLAVRSALTDDGRPPWMPLGCSFKTTDADSGKFRTTGAKGAAKPLVKLKSILVRV